MHGELLWRLIESIFKAIGVNFQGFIFIISLIMSYCTIKAINRWSPYRLISLFLAYPTIYLTYYYSSIREGIVIALFLNMGLKFLVQKNYLRYCSLVVICSLLHTAAIVLLAVPVIINIRRINLKRFLPIFFMLMIVVAITGVWRYILSSLTDGMLYVGKTNISILAILERVVMFVVISSMKKKNSRDDRGIDLFYKTYRIGFVLFILLSFSALLSQRLTAPLKATEILLVPMLIKQLVAEKQYDYNKKALAIVVAVLIMCTSTMIKNCNVMVSQGGYYDGVTMYNMPIVTIFQKDKIVDYRHNAYERFN